MKLTRSKLLEEPPLLACNGHNWQREQYPAKQDQEMKGIEAKIACQEVFVPKKKCSYYQGTVVNINTWHSPQTFLLLFLIVMYLLPNVPIKDNITTSRYRTEHDCS